MKKTDTNARAASGDDVAVSVTVAGFTLKLALNFIVVLLVIIGLIAPATIYALLRDPPGRYFARSADGHIVELKTLDEDAGTQAYLSQWVSDALTDTLTFDFQNARKHLTKASRLYFTGGGAEKLKIAIDQAKILQTVESKTLLLKTVTTQSPLVTSESVTVDGRHQYEVDTAVLLTYYAGREPTTQALPARVTLVRTSFDEHPGGLAIESIQISSHL